MSPASSRSTWSAADVGFAALLLIATLLAYMPALEGEFLLDDPVHVTSPELRSFDGLRKIWTEVGATQQYYPVLHTAFWLEHRIWGDSVIEYHLTNVLLHAFAACLIVLLMRRLGVCAAVLPATHRTRGSIGTEWFAAFLFALHPVAVESVAWIAEQKNTLSTVFCLGAALAFLRFEEDRRGRTYAFASLLFALALLSKTATATLPALLLVALWWRSGTIDIHRQLIPLLPWFAAAIAAGVITLRVEHGLMAGIGAALPLTSVGRVLLAGRAICFYVSTLIWPGGVTFFYERWAIDPAAPLQALFPLVVVATGVAVLWAAVRGKRGALAAFLCYVGALFPVLGFVNVEWFVFAYVADHFQYLASIVALIAVAAGLAAWTERQHASYLRGTARLGRAVKRARYPLAILVLGGLGAMTWRHSAHFRSNVALSAHAVERSPNSVVAHNHYGVALAKEPARLTAAIAEFEAALRLNPEAAEVHENLGDALMRLPARAPEAIAYYDAALDLKPSLPGLRQKTAAAHFDRAKELSAAPDRLADVIAEYQAAVKADPDFMEAHYNLGNALLKVPDGLPGAIEAFEAALRLKPDFPEAHTHLGTALARTPGRLGDAVAHFEAALRVNPDYEPARNNLKALVKALDEVGAAKQ